MQATRRRHANAARAGPLSHSHCSLPVGGDALQGHGSPPAAKTNFVVSHTERADRTGDYVAALAHSKHSIWRHVPLPFSTVPTWCPENRKDDRLHVSERLLNLHEVQPHYLLSLEERLGVHRSALDSDYDERNATTKSTLT